MRDRDVTTIGDLIYYQCAKIIVKSAFGVPGERETKGQALWVCEGEVHGIGKRRPGFVRGSGEGQKLLIIDP